MSKIIFISLLAFTTSLAIGQRNNTQNSSTQTHVAGIQDLCWSPDIKSIYFLGLWHKQDYSNFKPENWNVYKYDLLNKTTIKFIDSACYVAVSPSGQQIATGKIQDGNSNILIYDNDANNYLSITSHPNTDYAPSFSPDGKKILFNSTSNGQPEIYVINTDSTALQRLTISASGSSYNSPQWSPIGKKIAFYLGIPKRKDQLIVLDADGSNKNNLSNDSLQNFYPSWIRKEKIIYTHRMNDTNNKVCISPNGKRNKHFHKIESFYTRISPNGELIAYVDTKDQCIKVVS